MDVRRTLVRMEALQQGGGGGGGGGGGPPLSVTAGRLASVDIVLLAASGERTTQAAHVELLVDGVQQGLTAFVERVRGEAGLYRAWLQLVAAGPYLVKLLVNGEVSAQRQGCVAPVLTQPKR